MSLPFLSTQEKIGGDRKDSTIEGRFYFPRQSLKRFTFRVKLSDSICFLLGLSPIVKLIRHEKQIFLSILRGKYYLIHLEIKKRHKK